jgi:hypothetical protein
MEPLWSPVVATLSNRWQVASAGKAQKQAKFVAVRCPPLPEPSNGKEGVSGSSPEEGFAKFLLISSFCLPVRRLF